MWPSLAQTPSTPQTSHPSSSAKAAAVVKEDLPEVHQVNIPLFIYKLRDLPCQAVFCPSQILSSLQFQCETSNQLLTRLERWFFFIIFILRRQFQRWNKIWCFSIVRRFSWIVLWRRSNYRLSIRWKNSTRSFAHRHSRNRIPHLLRRRMALASLRLSIQPSLQFLQQNRRSKPDQECCVSLPAIFGLWMR